LLLAAVSTSSFVENLAIIHLDLLDYLFSVSPRNTLRPSSGKHTPNGAESTVRLDEA